MNRFFERFLDPSAPDRENEVQYWRERILAVVLISAAVLGSGIYVTNLVSTIQHRSWGWIIIYTLSYAGILLIAFSHWLSYNMRAGVLLALFYALGVVSALQYANVGDVRIWLVGFSILAGVFLSLQAGIVAAICSTITLLSIGMMMNQGWIAIPSISDAANPANFSSWINTSIPFLTVNIIIVLSLGVIINGLNKSLQRGHSLTTELERDRARLEQRTQALERSEVQVHTAAEITQAISAELDPATLFQQVVNLVKERFGLYYAGVFSIDEKGLYAILRAGTGEAGQKMLSEGHKVAIGGTSTIGWAISRRQARIALDVGPDAVHFDNPHLPLTRSELALPMISGPQVLGTLTVQSEKPEAFDQDDITVLQGVADGLAIAMENATLFQQVQANLEEIRRLNQQYLGEAWTDVTMRGADLSYTFENKALGADRRPPTADVSPLTTDRQPAASSDQATTINVPLMLREQVIGNLTLEADKETWSPDEQSFIEAVATQAGLALENVRLVEETQRASQHDRIVADITSKVWASTDIDTILRTTLRELGQTLQASDGLIQLDVPQTNEESTRDVVPQLP
ncbi:MAG: GAF domain-containing protein [Chloroflexi bacterium]|nr:GAF domain-containing protein [Chloroflexota bacterium]